MRTEGQAFQRTRDAKVFARGYSRRSGLCLLPPIPSQQVQRQTKPFPMGSASACELQHPHTSAVGAVCEVPKPALVGNHRRSCRRCNESRPGRQCGHGRHGRHCQARHGYKICGAKTAGQDQNKHIELTARATSRTRLRRVVSHQPRKKACFLRTVKVRNADARLAVKFCGVMVERYRLLQHVATL